MGEYSFIKESSIKHNKDVVIKHIKPLTPLNYNKFMWWRTHTDRNIPLSKKSPLKERILNGDFNPSSYYWQAQLVLYNAKDKIDLTKDDHQSQMEKLSVDLARYKKLMEDFEKEENNRLEALYDAFKKAFNISHEELEIKFLNWPDDILSFYNHNCNYIKKTTPENRKVIRDPSRKEKIKILDIKRKRGRPRKDEIF